MNPHEEARRHLDRLRAGAAVRHDATVSGWPPDLAREFVERTTRRHYPPEELATPRVRATVERLIDRANSGDIDDLMSIVLARRQRDIEDTASDWTMHFDPRQRPLVRHIRTGQLNAVCGLDAHDPSRYVVLFHDQMPLFISQLSRVVSWSVPRCDAKGDPRDDTEGPWSFRWSVSDVTARIDRVPEIVRWFADIVVTFAATGTIGVNSRQTLPRDYLRLAEDLETSVTYFVLSHEYAHIMNGHLGNAAPDADGPVEEAVTHSWEQELEADFFGLLLSMNTAIGRHIPFERAFLGPGLFFDAMDVMDRAVAILQSGDENALQIGSHPHSHLRKQRVREALSQLARADPSRSDNVQMALGLDDIQAAIVRLLWERTAPIMYELHREGVAAARTWRSLIAKAPSADGPTLTHYTPDPDSRELRDLRERYDQHPDQVPLFAMNVLARHLCDRGDRGGARKLYQRAIDAGVSEIAQQATVNLAMLLDEDGKSAAAEELYRQVLNAAQDHVAASARFKLGLLLTARGETAAGEELLARAIDTGDADIAPRATFMLAATQHERGQLDTARELYRRAADSGHHEAAPAAASGLAQLLAEQGDDAGAQEAHQRVIESEHPTRAPMAMLQLGLQRHEEGDADAAEALYRCAIDSGHATAAPSAIYALARLHKERGDAEGARQFYRHAIASDHPDMAPWALHGLGNLLREQGDDAGARECYERAVATGHSGAAVEATFALAVLAEQRGDVAAAEALYQRAIDSGDNDTAPRAMFNLARLWEMQGESYGARDLYLRAVASGHAHTAPRSLVNLGRVLEELGDHDAARESYQRAVESDHIEASPLAAVALGILRQQDGDVAEARALFRRAVASGHADAAPRGMYCLAVVFHQEGDLAGARELYEQAVASGHRVASQESAENLARLPSHAAPPGRVPAGPRQMSTEPRTWRDRWRRGKPRSGKSA